MTEWSVEIVRARFVEAADTERRMPEQGRGNSGGYRPAYVHSFKDINGWGTKRLAEERELRFRRIPPTASAISRHDEVMRWTGEMIADVTVRRMVWAWACSQVIGSSFSDHCRKSGWPKATAYRRIQATMERISAVLRNDGVLLRLPDETWLRQQQPDMAHIYGTMGTGDGEPTKSPTSQIFDGDRPLHTLKSPQAIEEFARHLSELNRGRRRRQGKRGAQKDGPKYGAIVYQSS